MIANATSISALFMALSRPTPHVSAIPPSSFTPILPHELWHEIFQLATFIPDELEVSHMFRPGVFGGGRNGPQQIAWRKILPLRLAIQNVSRLWHSIGVEYLYQSFHCSMYGNGRAKPALLASTLRIKPSYGALVKHLTLELSTEKTINAEVTFILRSCPNALILRANVSSPSIPVLWWDACSLLTSLRYLQIDVYSLPISRGPPNEFLPLDVHGGDPAPIGSIVLPNLRHFHLKNWYNRDATLAIERILALLSLPCLTSLSLELSGTSSTPLLCKDLLSRLTYLRMKGRSLLPSLFQVIEFPLLHIFQFDGHRIPQGTLLFECPNLPIHQIDILILGLPGSGIDHSQFTLSRFDEWCTSVHCILTEARDPMLMPKLKRVILEERFHPFIGPRDLYPSYGDLVSCYSPLADAFESRGVELSVRNRDVIFDVDVPIRDFILQMKGRF